MLLAAAGTQLWSFDQELEKLCFTSAASPTSAPKTSKRRSRSWAKADLRSYRRSHLPQHARGARPGRALWRRATIRWPLLAPIAVLDPRLLIARQFMETKRRARRRLSPDESPH
jgi:hypothetical protein